MVIDSVMLDHIAEGIDTQGDNAPAWVRDCLNHHNFLEYAMTGHGQGVFERKPYKRIEYTWWKSERDWFHSAGKSFRKWS